MGGNIPKPETQNRLCKAWSVERCEICRATDSVPPPHTPVQSMRLRGFYSKEDAFVFVQTTLLKS